MKVAGKTIVVTGAGSGMGRALVVELVRKGARVAALDINQEAVLETAQLVHDAKGLISTHVTDISDRTSVEKLVQEVIDYHGTVDGIINNAGIIQPFVDIKELRYEKIEQVMNVNFYGTLYMVKSFLPELLKRPEGHIMNISSMGGFLPVPGQSIYGASKAAVKLMTEAFHSELLDTNVGVTVAFPGAIKTNIMKNSKVVRKTTTDQTGKEYKLTSAEDAANMIIKAIETNVSRVMVGNDAKTMDRLYRIMPKKASAIIAEKLKN